SLGDVVHTLPLAAAIRQHEPDARIIWLVEESEQVLLVDNPVVDDVLLVPLRRWRDHVTSATRWSVIRHELGALGRRLRELKIDVTIDVQGWGHKTSPFVWLTRAPMRVGFDRPNARDPLSTLFTTVRVTPPPSAKHVVDLNLALLGPLGITDPGFARFPLPAFVEADARIASWFRDRAIRTLRVVALLPSTRGPQKLWPVESYRELGRRLLAPGDVTLLVLGGPGEETRLEQVCASLPAERVISWAGGPVPELTAILRRVDLVIGNDTGPLHLAAAHDVPALGLFGPTRGERNGPYGPKGAFIQSRTGRMSDISVDEVEAKAASLAAATTSRPRAARR
ncbi:MAG TPA: glycosyltransferase family 9 protein, partial [Caldimonas sp.]|nr:glycosyltransferase family 9 protein [Caldimonas sp.]